MKPWLHCFMVASALLCASAIPAESDSQPPAIKVGDTWTYRYLDGWKAKWTNPPLVEMTHRVTRADHEIFSETVEVKHSGATSDLQTYTREMNALKIVSPGANDFTTNQLEPHVEFPLEDGKTWRAKTETTTARGYYVDRWTGKVVGHETVTVPAGTFDAIRVELSATSISPQQILMKNNRFKTIYTYATLWYSPQVKRAVKQVYYTQDTWWWDLDRDTYELVSYQVN